MQDLNRSWRHRTAYDVIEKMTSFCRNRSWCHYDDVLNSKLVFRKILLNKSHAKFVSPWLSVTKIYRWCSTSGTPCINPALYYTAFCYCSTVLFKNNVEFLNYSLQLWIILFFFRLNFTENDLAVEKQMNNFWGHFAHNGIPTTNLSSWPYYSRNTEVKLFFWIN